MAGTSLADLATLAKTRRGGNWPIDEAQHLSISNFVRRHMSRL
jgi:hypothetical protein